MTVIEVDAVCAALGVRADDGDEPPGGGMSGSTLFGAKSRSGTPVIVKATALGSRNAADGARRELHVYVDLARRLPIPAPRLVAAHEAGTWIAIALERHHPTPPAPAWTSADWVDLAHLLGRLHASTRDAEHPPAAAPGVGARTHDDLLEYARRLWDGPGDAARLARAIGQLDGIRQAAAAGPRSWVHGDSHLGNAVRTADGRLLLVDWQSARIGPSAGDIAFALTRAAAVASAVPRARVIDAYSAAAGVDPDPTRRAVTAHQLLILVEQYPGFADFLDPQEVDALRRALAELLDAWEQGE